MSKKGITGNEPNTWLVYADIIDWSRWQLPTRKPMSMLKKAAQFYSFDALNGYMHAQEERATDELQDQILCPRTRSRCVFTP